MYDAAGNRLRYHDADGSTYNYEYASWDLRTRVIDPMGWAVTYGYTSTGNLASVTDPGGTTHEFTYDYKDRLTLVRRHGVLMEEYFYDLADNLVEKRNGKGEQLLSFEIGLGNLKKVRRLASGENHSFAYDPKGRLLKAATDDFEVLFAYDGHGNRVQELRDGRGVQHRFHGNAVVETTVLGKFTTRYRWRSLANW